MKLWCLAVPNVMEGHRFSDDVALCEAETKEEAVEKFSKLYSYSKLHRFVKEVNFNSHGIAILTDY